MRWRLCLITGGLSLTLTGCGASTQPSSASLVTEQIQGRFEARPWVHSRTYSINTSGTLAVDVVFDGDYSDLLHIELWNGNRLIGDAIAQGQVAPRKRLITPIPTPGQYELRLSPDKCCTSYTGVVVRPL